MSHGNLMRGGIVLLLIAALWAPLASASAEPSRSVDTDAGWSASGPLDVSGWLDVFESLLRVLTGEDEGDGGGTLDPAGTPGTGSGGTSGAEGTTGTTGTGTTETTEGGFQAP